VQTHSDILKAIVNVNAANGKVARIFNKRADSVYIKDKERNFSLGENSLNLGARSAVKIACVFCMLKDTAV